MELKYNIKKSGKIDTSNSEELETKKQTKQNEMALFILAGELF